MIDPVIITIGITSIHLLIDLYSTIISKFYIFSSDCCDKEMFNIEVGQTPRNSGEVPNVANQQAIELMSNNKLK